MKHTWTKNISWNRSKIESRSKHNKGRFPNSIFIHKPCLKAKYSNKDEEEIVREED